MPGIKGVRLLYYVVKWFQSIVCACNAWFTAINFPISEAIQNPLYRGVPCKLWEITPPLSSNLPIPGLKKNVNNIQIHKSVFELLMVDSLGSSYNNSPHESSTSESSHLDMLQWELPHDGLHNRLHKVQCKCLHQKWFHKQCLKHQYLPLAGSQSVIP